MASEMLKEELNDILKMREEIEKITMKMNIRLQNYNDRQKEIQEEKERKIREEEEIK